jgi:type I restriction enzyme S subunit
MIDGTKSEAPLGELGVLDRGKSRHRPRYAHHLYGGNYPFIQTGDIKSANGRIVSFEQTYSEAGLAQSRIWDAGTLCITIAANIGETAILTFPACFPDSVVGFISDEKLAHTPYIAYALRYLRDRMQRDASGSVQDNINLEYLRNLEVPVFPIQTQKAIAHILGTLDDKIELNQKTNQTLEGIAKAIFKSWFVDFDPVRAKAEGRPTGLPPEISDLFPDELVDSEIGQIPKGWNCVPLDQIGNFRNGLALQKYPALDGEEKLPVVKIAQLRKGSTDGDDLFASGVPTDFVITDGDYVFAWSGSLMAKYWVGGRGALNQHLFKVEEKTQPLWFIAGWVEHFMTEFQSIAESKATTMGHIKREHLKQAICAIPSQKLIDRSAEVITSLISRSILSQQESRVLTELRDTLLPKLISGELRIPDAEKFLEGAGI